MGAQPWPKDDCSVIDFGTTTWMLISMALVLLMTPALAIFYGGLIHRKSVLTIIMQCFFSMGLVSLLWAVVGFSLAYGESIGGLIGDPMSYPLFSGLYPCTPVGYPMQEGPGNYPGLLFAGYQMTFAIICPALITGAFADRVTFPAYLIFISLWLLTVYCPLAHWIWNPAGFLALWGVRDFAGGIVLHVSAGFSALASVVVVGPRVYASLEDFEKANVPHNRTFVALGTGLLWFGWFGFNGGSAYAADGVTVFAVVNSCLASATAMVTWTAIEWRVSGKPGVVGACIGSVVGLATITPAAGFVMPWAAMLIGFAGAAVCFACIGVLHALHFDDVLDVWACHGMGGVVGSVMLGALADSRVNGEQGGWEFLGKQSVAVLAVAVLSFAVSVLELKLVDLIVPVIPSEEEIARGLDMSFHGEAVDDLDAALRDPSVHDKDRAARPLEVPLLPYHAPRGSKVMAGLSLTRRAGDVAGSPLQGASRALQREGSLSSLSRHSSEEDLGRAEQARAEQRTAGAQAACEGAATDAFLEARGGR